MCQLQWNECGFLTIVVRQDLIPFLVSEVKITPNSKFAIVIKQVNDGTCIVLAISDFP